MRGRLAAMRASGGKELDLAPLGVGGEEGAWASPNLPLWRGGNVASPDPKVWGGDVDQSGRGKECAQGLEIWQGRGTCAKGSRILP